MPNRSGVSEDGRTEFEMTPDPPEAPMLPPDLRQTVARVVAEQRLKQELGPGSRRVQQHLNRMLRACRSKEEQQWVRRCLQQVEVGGVPWWVPRRAVALEVRQLLTLMQRGLRFGKVDPHFEIRVVQAERVPYCEGAPLPEPRWGERFACVLKHDGLIREYRLARQAVAEADRAEASPRSVRSKLLREALEADMFAFRVPTRFDLDAPPELKLEASVLVTEEGATLENQFPERTRRTLERQQARLCPSLLHQESWPVLRKARPAVVILLDISSSTFERDLFKMANLACAALLKHLKACIPKIALRVIPYSDSALPSFERFDGFVPPGGTTAYEAAFAAAQGYLEKWEGTRTLVHLTDGLPNSLDLARAAAERFPEAHIEYGQLIFGHTKRVSDLADYLQRPHNSEPGRYEKYVDCFTSVAQACSGAQTVLWVMNRMPEAVLSMTDLVLGTHFEPAS